MSLVDIGHGVGTSYGADIFPALRLCLLYEIIIIVIIFDVVIINISPSRNRFMFTGFKYELSISRRNYWGEVLTDADVSTVCVPQLVFCGGEFLQVGLGGGGGGGGGWH